MTLREDVLKLSGIDYEQNSEESLDEDIGLVSAAVSVGAVVLAAIINAMDSIIQKSKFKKAKKKNLDRLSWEAANIDKITFAHLGFPFGTAEEMHSGVVFGLNFMNKYLAKSTDKFLISDDKFDKFLAETKKETDKAFKELADLGKKAPISDIKEKFKKATKKCDTLIDVLNLLGTKHVVTIHFMAYDKLTKEQKSKLKNTVKKSAEVVGLPVKIRLAEVSKLKMDKKTKSYAYGMQGAPEKIKDEDGNEYTRIY